MKYLEQLSDIFVNYSLDIQPGERVFIKYKNGVLSPLVTLVVEKVIQKGGIPCVKMEDLALKYLLNSIYSKKDAEMVVAQRQFEIDNFDASISLGYNVPMQEFKPNPEFKKEYARLMQERGLVGKGPKKWVLFNYPSELDASKAMQEYSTYEDAYLGAVFYDYKKLKQDALALQDLLTKTTEIKIVAPGTNIVFRKDNIPSVILAGEHNLPDGEIYTAPVKYSVNGYVSFNVPTIRDGHKFEEVKLRFVDGKVVDFEVKGDKTAFENFLDMDDGSRYIGEFAFGLNKNLVTPVIDTLCDEKIAGSVHFALGNCYKNASNGNKSSLHWDLIKILTPEYGGGQVYFDGKLIQKDGAFIIDECKALNKDSQALSK